MAQWSGGAAWLFHQSRAGHWAVLTYLRVQCRCVLMDQTDRPVNNNNNHCCHCCGVLTLLINGGSPTGTGKRSFFDRCSSTCLRHLVGIPPPWAVGLHDDGLQLQRRRRGPAPPAKFRRRPARSGPVRPPPAAPMTDGGGRTDSDSIDHGRGRVPRPRHRHRHDAPPISRRHNSKPSTIQHSL